MFLFLSTESYSQKIDLSGTVISVYGNPIPGLQLILEGAQMKVTTDKEGKFHFLRDGGTPVNRIQKHTANNSSEMKNFIYIENTGRLPLSLYNKAGVVYDLTGKAISLHNRKNGLPQGLYFTKSEMGIDRNPVSFRIK